MYFKFINEFLLVAISG